MKLINPLNILGVIEGLLIPAQKAISVVLPDFIEEDLRDEDVRKQIVAAADKILTSKHPEARFMPEDLRHRILSKSLSLLIDDIVLPMK